MPGQQPASTGTERAVRGVFAGIAAFVNFYVFGFEMNILTNGELDPAKLANPFLHSAAAGLLLSVLSFPPISDFAGRSPLRRGGALALAAGFAVSIVRNQQHTDFGAVALVPFIPAILCAFDVVIRIVISPPRPGRGTKG